MSKTIMISQPMRDLTYEQIVANRAEAVKKLESEGWDVVDTIINIDEVNHKHNPVACLSESIKFMSDVDAVYFLKGWDEARGCKIEHDVAIAYGIPVIYEEM